jgi:hypothetical protein
VLLEGKGGGSEVGISTAAAETVVLVGLESLVDGVVSGIGVGSGVGVASGVEVGGGVETGSGVDVVVTWEVAAIGAAAGLVDVENVV